jgi:hypothetical protein
LASIGQRGARKIEANHWVGEINAHNFINPNAFSVVNILLQDEHLLRNILLITLLYYFAQIYLTQSRDISW